MHTYPLLIPILDLLRHMIIDTLAYVDVIPRLS